MTDQTSLPATAQPHPPKGTAAAARLTRRQKAAIVVRFLLNEGAEVPLGALPEDLQAVLTQQLGDMSLVDRQTLAQVVGEFVEELDGIGLAFPRGIAGALSVLDGRISPQTAARLRKEAGVREAGDPWDRIRALEIEELLPIFARESTEVAAVLLSKLDVTKAATLLGQMPGADAQRITYAVSRTSAVTPEAVDRIGLSLAAQLDATPERAFDEEAEARIGAILNYSAAMTRDSLLEGLEETDRDLADRVRAAIFTFADIPARLAALDVPKIIREIDQADLATALAHGAESQPDTVEHILGNLSRRMADQLREDMQDMGRIKPSVGEAAQTAIVGAIRRLEAAGELTLLSDGDEDA